MVDATEMYTLTREAAWIGFLDPGFHRQAGSTLNPVAQRDANARFSAVIIVYTSQQNVRGAVNDALNKAVPKAYRRNPNGIRVREVRQKNDPREVIATLTTCYGQKTTTEVNNQDNRWRMDWNPSEPIEELIDWLEDYYIFVVYMPPAYTPAQRIKRAHTQVKRTGLYPTAVVEWEGFSAVNKSWPEWKEHFIEAYELKEASGIAAAQAGYHGADNAHDDDERNLNESLAQF